jgi:hypothetical protein
MTLPKNAVTQATDKESARGESLPRGADRENLDAVRVERAQKHCYHFKPCGPRVRSSLPRRGMARKPRKLRAPGRFMFDGSGRFLSEACSVLTNIDAYAIADSERVQVVVSTRLAYDARRNAESQLLRQVSANGPGVYLWRGTQVPTGPF